LEKTYLGLWADQPAETGLSDPGRQILHTTFGSVLTDPKLGAELHQCLAEHTALHRSLLAEHLTDHLTALRAGM